MSDENNGPALVEIRWAIMHPDQRGGQHAGTGSLFCRFGTGPWRAIHAYRSQHKLLTDLSALFELEEE